MITKWDKKLLSLAAYVSDWSHDPSTKVGAVIARPDNTIASIGYNGFPQGILDDDRYYDRELKYAMIIHAEANAIVNAKESLIGDMLYCYPLPPCSSCAGLIIRSGIKKVVAPKVTNEHRERWGKNMKIAEDMFNEAGVSLYYEN